ncbi:hypothetical protein GMDG_04688 [Pseudogymnoascus destructans 20631-21]|uniref:Uncharacterized protein n=1 Tax=Pseudogymnoascus destructans (strain ATCC MYA-4855 / 20631-21) TaxID=658429 RepID=L8GAR2_PSED2|nr:hypothetical protein GMDG_04688 [Pseudogymnoascus destructans 20631-21]
MATEHEEGLSSIIEGIRSSDERDCGYLIHTSDISMLVDQALALGEYEDRVNDDVADFDRIKEKLSKHPRGLETMIMNAAAHNTENRRPVKTAIISSSAVYGFGRGPISKRGGKLTAMMRAIILHKSPFKVENGKNYWSAVDIDNLARAYLCLVEKALGPVGVGDGHWDSKGYYVAETEELCWAEFAQDIGERVQERLFVDEPVVMKKLTASEVDAIYAGGSTYWGTNARCIGSRLRQIGWNPERADLIKYVNQILRFEIEDLYGITIEEQELEEDERRPRGYLDNSPALQASFGNVINENSPVDATTERRDRRD